MIPRASTRMPLALSLVAALLAGMLGSAVPAVAYQPDRIVLAGATLPTLVADASGVILAAAHKQQVLDPAATVFTASAGQEAVSQIALDTTALPAGTTLSDVQLRYAVTAAPDGGTVSAQTVDAGNARTSWPADTPLPVSAAATPGLALTFDRAGTYTVMVTATMTATTAPASGPAPTENSTAAPVTLNTAYTFDISTPAPMTGAGSSGSETTGGEPGAAPSAASKLQANTAVVPAASVVSTGDVRLTTSLEAGELVQGLADYTNDPKGTPLDLASTVFAVPTAEEWPGGNDGEDPGLWGKIVPDHGQVWRTAAGGVGANTLALSLDSSAIPVGEVYGNPDFFGEGGISSRLGSISGPGTGALLWGGFDDGGTSFHAGVQSAWKETGPPGDFGFALSQQSFANAFTTPGRYCVTLETFAQRAGTGTVLNHDVTLTFAVGTMDPSTVEPCSQPAPIPSQAPVPGPATASGVTVIDSGVALLGSTVTDRALSLDVVTADRGRTTAHDPAKVVFSLPNRDSRWPGTPYWADAQSIWALIAPRGTLPWRTTGLYPSAYSSLYSLDEQANALALDLEARFIGSDILDPSAGVTYQFTGASTTSTSAYFKSYRAGGSLEGAPTFAEDVAFWDSRPGGDRTDQTAAATPIGALFDPLSKEKNQGSSALGTVFSEAGVYCVSLRTSATLADGTPVEDRATFTFAVGIDPATVTPCAQTADPGGGPTDPVDPGGPEDRDPTVTWFEKGHLDLRPRHDGNGGLEFVTGEGDPTKMPLLKDAVWVGRGDYATFQVPEPNELQDRTFIGPPGSSYYGFLSTPAYESQTLWPGLSLEGLGPSFFDFNTTWRMSKMSGPGDVVVWHEAKEFLNSRTRASSWFPMPGASHVHQNWAFTQPGVYCLGVEAKGRPSADPSRDMTGVGVLTVAVGDVDLSTVQPCGRSQTTPTFLPDPIEQVSPDRTVYTNATVQGNGSTSTLELAEVDGRMEVVAGLTRPIGTATGYYDPDRVVYTMNPAGDQHQLPVQIATAVERPEISRDVRVRMGQVTGPGDWWLSNALASDPFATILDTREATASSETILRSGYVFRSTQWVSRAGVYCVPLTWSGKTAAGASFQVTKTLTFAAGVDPNGVTPCAEGGEGTGPTDPGPTDPGPDPRPDPGPVVWDVPNQSLTDSGATILNVGHVDVASRLDDGKLRTQVKDDTTGDTTYRDPSRTVLQLRPGAEATVPGADAFRFLGKAGARVWQVEEVQQEGLLWPGWSTEQIGRGLIPGGVDWKLERVQGPGEFALYQSGVFGVPNVLFNTRDGVTGADRFTIPEHVHAHGTWTFSAEGVYCLGFTRSAALANGARVSDTFTLAYAVGKVNVKGIDPAACFTEPPGKPDTVDTTPVNPAQLTDANAGGVRVLNSADGFSPGQLVTVQVGAEHAGHWVSVWLHSRTNPVWLGWAHVGASGAAQVRLPADTPPDAHRIVIKDRDGALIGWDSLSVIPAPQAPTRPGAPGLDATPASQQVAATQCKAGATILSSGHVDYASRIVGGKLRSLIGDDTSGSKVYREPAGTILWLKPSSRVTLPGGYGPVGPAGSNVWQVPQTQNPALIWMGWNTEVLNAGNTRGPVSWTVDSISGPGQVKVYLSGSFGGVQQMVFNNGGSYSIPLGVHAHANWAFSAEGVYRIRTTQTATLANGQASSDTQTLTIVVGNVDPATAAGGSGTGCGTVSNAVLLTDDKDGAMKAAEQAAAAAAAARAVLPGEPATGDGGGFTDPFTALAQGNPVPLLLSILGLLFLAGAGGAGVLWWRRRSGARGGVSA